MDAASRGPKSSHKPHKQRRPNRLAAGPTRRCTNACNRCKRQKAKCYYDAEKSATKCVACVSSSSECAFDAPADGDLRSLAYIATLESRVQALEQELELATTQASQTRESTGSFDAVHHAGAVTVARDEPVNTTSAPKAALPQDSSPSSDEVTIHDLLYGGAQAGNIDCALATLPSEEIADSMLETVFLYTQARYCIVDWMQLRAWHKDRAELCKATVAASIATQTAAFFIWLTYAIGARFISRPEASSEGYFARARIHLPVVLAQRNVFSVQAMLSLTQYYFRATTATSLWHLVGVNMRLCIELGYHRSINLPSRSGGRNAYTLELEKRFFWCAYCFDRCISMLAKLPFAIRDLDIDIEEPIDVNLSCTDHGELGRVQLQQSTALQSMEPTTMTAAIHHLRVYRIRSSIVTRFTWPNASVPSTADIMGIITEVNDWKQQVPAPRDPAKFPQQNAERLEATYLQAVLLIIRPALLKDEVDISLLHCFASFAADACVSARILSLSPYTHPDRIIVYHCFYCGMVLLQCLSIWPTVIPMRRTYKAITACSGALAIYARAIPSMSSFLQLFDELSIRFSDDETIERQPNPALRSLLNRIVASDPAEAPGILSSLPTTAVHDFRTPTTQSVSDIGGLSQCDADTTQPLTTVTANDSWLPIDYSVSPYYMPNPDIANVWTEPWLTLMGAETETMSSCTQRCETWQPDSESPTG